MGAAYLSLEAGVPIIPAGIRLPDAHPGSSPPHGPLEIYIGHPLRPPSLDSVRVPNAVLRAWHAALMGEISRLSRKTWISPKGAQRWTMRAA